MHSSLFIYSFFSPQLGYISPFKSIFIIFNPSVTFVLKSVFLSTWIHFNLFRLFHKLIRVVEIYRNSSINNQLIYSGYPKTQDKSTKQAYIILIKKKLQLYNANWFWNHLFWSYFLNMVPLLYYFHKNYTFYVIYMLELHKGFEI